MSIYKLGDKNLTPIPETPISLEKNIQKITEDNLGLLFGLEFVQTEFQLHNLRIDTLAFDQENNSFVIIEYKKGKSYSVVDQGFSYLSLLLNNKADFVLEYNETLNKNIKKDSIDWSQSRVIFISPSFSTYQLNAINFRNLPIELWQVDKYEGDIYSYTEIKGSDQNEDIETISKDPNVKKISKEIKKYTIDDQFKKSWEESRELFNQLRERVLELDEKILERPQKFYIAYKLPSKGKFNNIIEIVGQASGLKVYLDMNKEEIADPENMVKDCSKVGHWATGNSFISISDEKQLDYAMYLIKQVYLNFK